MIELKLYVNLGQQSQIMTLQSLQIWAHHLIPGPCFRMHDTSPEHGIPNEASPRSDQVDYPNLKRAIDEIDRQQRQKTLLLAHPRKKKTQILQGNLSTRSEAHGEDEVG